MFERSSIKILLKRIAEPRKFIQVIAGPRQVGKTTLVDQAAKKSKLHFHFASADETISANTIWIDQQWETARIKASAKKNKTALLIIDEIQKIEDWSKQVKKNWDNDTRKKIKVKVVILGSAQLLLQKGLTESLTGRFELLQLTQWSYTEMKAAFKFTPEQYVWFGGYPGAASLVKDPIRWKNYILHSLIETSVSKDILMLNRVDKPALLRKLFELGSSYSGQILSFNKILGQFLDAGNTTTLSHYLELLNSAGLLCGLEKYSPRKVSTRSSSPKFQVKDNTFISVYSSISFNEIRKNPIEWGRMVESAIGVHLVNSSITSGYEVFYWREKNDELDFIITKGKKIIGIEVKTNSRFKISGAKAFQKNFKPDKLLLIGDSGINWQDFLKMNPDDLF
jgi:predicted AAA+ superfamily ATPase